MTEGRQGDFADRVAHSAREQYGLALLLTVGAFIVTLGLLAVTDEPIYAPLFGAIAVTAWLGGVGPAALSVVVGWSLALWLLVDPDGPLELGSGRDVTSWAVSLAVGTLIVVISGALRIGKQRATEAAVETESSLRRVEAIQQLSTELAGAVSSAEVSHVFAARAATLLGAQGAAMGLLESDDLLVVDPVGLAAAFHVPGRRVSLDEATLLSIAAREGRLVRADDRATLERAFPGSAAILPLNVRSAIAVPLHVAGKPLGVVEFLFDRADAIDDELAALASMAAGLTEQALGRARLYERERETNRALERILQVAPRFHAETAAAVTEVICREARITFGSDYGVLWRIRDGVLELLGSDPTQNEWPTGLQVPLENFPGLVGAVESLGVSFVPDVLAEARGEGLERVRQLGIRSSLRSPIVIGGRTELVLVVSWRAVIDTPDPMTIAIVRRFADQAGLAFETLERRRAEEQAAARADENERLQEITAALSNALTQDDVAEVVAAAALEGTHAVSAVLYEVVEERQSLRRLASSRAPDNGAEPTAEMSLDEDAVLARVARRSSWGLEPPPDASGSAVERTRLAAPLVSGRRSVGVLDLAWDEPVTLDDDDYRFLRTLASQGAQALDRARHFESERTIAETLQRSVLPVALPNVAGVQIAARYLPGTRGVDIGGDWFDAVELRDGRLGLMVGDVVGKGVHAAANMGQLRNALRAISVERLKPPSALTRLDRLASDGLESTFATVVYAVVDTSAGVLRHSSAGHPPPVVAYPDGRVELLEGGRGLPLGTGLHPKYRQSVVELPAGSIVLLYTDGLVERRGSSIDDGLEALIAAMRDGPTDAEQLLEHVLDQLLAGADRADDIAILAARFLPVAPQPLDLLIASRERSLHLVRDAIRTWLEGTELPRGDSEELLLAVWEVCANAIEHAEDPFEDAVRVRANVNQSRVRIVVDDTGRFVPVAVRPNRGLGLRLTEELASDVEITMSERGTTVALEKNLP